MPPIMICYGTALIPMMTGRKKKNPAGRGDYVRTMITNMTTSALMVPIVLPIYDPRVLFKD